MSALAAIDPTRLQDFLAQAGPLFRANAKSNPGKRPQRDLSPDRLRACLSAVSAPLAATRRTGAFANPWTIAGLKRDEVRTAAVLAWLLDPAGSHGGGDAYAEALWHRVTGGEPRFALTGLRTATTEQCPLGDEFNRVDVVLEGDSFLVFIEVKIDAPLRYRQLEDYQDALNRKSQHLGKAYQLLLLSVTRHDVPEGCLTFYWRDMSQAIRKAARTLTATGHDCRLPLAFANHIDRLHG